jgi:hypothetical protein
MLAEATITKLLDTLGIDPAAADLDAEVSQALDELVTEDELANMEKGMNELSEELLSKDFESLNPADEKEKEELTNALRNSTDRKATLKVLINRRPAAPTSAPRIPLVNRQPAQAPDATGADDRKAVQIRNRAHELRVLSNKRRSFADCWRQAETEINPKG